GRRASRRRTGPRRLGTPHPPVFRLALVHLQGLKFYATADAPPVLVRLRVRASVPPKTAAEAPEGRRPAIALDVAVRPAPAIRDSHKRGSRQRADEVRQVEPPRVRAVQAGARGVEPPAAGCDAERVSRRCYVAQGFTSRLK